VIRRVLREPNRGATAPLAGWCLTAAVPSQDLSRDLESLARAALPGYGVGADAELVLVSLSENAVFAVEDPVTGTRSVLRLHRPGYHSRRAIESELAWVTALRSDGVVDTPPVLPARDGGLVTAVATADGGHRFAVRFDWVPGVEPAGDRLVDDFRTLGATAARLHAHARCWRRPPWFTRLTWDHAGSVGPRGHWGRWQDGVGVGTEEAAVLGRLEAVLGRRLAAFGAGPERFGLVHADMRLANLLVDDAAHMTLLDFDDCGFGWYLYDLGAALSFLEDDPRVPELVDAWVTGYRSAGVLSAEEVAELPTFVLLRRLLLVAWVGSHQEAPFARSLGAAFTRRSCDLAEAYLSRFG
jgi:Ser/Thr protein kinase RdoA (MazF antagonist)